MAHVVPHDRRGPGHPTIWGDVPNEPKPRYDTTLHSTKHLRWRATLIAVLLVLACTTESRAESPVTDALVLTGVRALTEAKVRRLAGGPPDDRARLDDWAYTATRRIVSTYHRRGYTYARAFWAVQPDDTVWLHVDEGVMSRVLFDGTSDLQAVVMRVDLSLPFDTVHGPTLDLAVAELGEKYGLHHVEWEVLETDDLETMPTGQEVTQQVLRIRIEQEESFGWGASVALDSSWGLLPTGSVSVRGLAFEDDSLHADLAVGVPYRRYIFDAEPKAQWVHGRIGLEWRLPTIAWGVLAPFAASSVALSQSGRSDVGFESFLVLRDGLLGGLALHANDALTVSIGIGADLVRLYDVTQTSLDPVDADTVRGVPVIQQVVEALFAWLRVRAERRGVRRCQPGCVVEVQRAADGATLDLHADYLSLLPP